MFICLYAFAVFSCCFFVADCADLEAITMEQIEEAFGKAREEVSIQGVKLELITSKYRPKALLFVRNQLLPKDPIHKAFEITWNDELQDLWLEVLSMNLSLMFVDEKTNDIIALQATRIASKNDSIIGQTEDLLEYMVSCDEKADFFEHYNITDAFHFLNFGENARYEVPGSASQLFQTAIIMIRHFGFDSVYIKGEGSSTFTQSIYETAAFDVLYESCMLDINGTTQGAEEELFVNLYGLKVTQND